jgi:hypothetical protein
MVGNVRANRIRSPGDNSGGSGREPRRAVSLAGFGLLQDGTTFALSVLDLSYDGCKIGTPIALLPGVDLKLSVPRIGGSLAAKVRWSRNGRAGLEFETSEAAPRPHVSREHERQVLGAELLLRRRDRPQYRSNVSDLTPTGCKVEFVDRPQPGELVWAKFDHLDGLEATVRWVDGPRGGIKFVRPIHPAVFELLLEKLRS